MRLDPRIRTALLRWLERPPVPPADAPPTVDELIALSDGHLEPERRRQVLAHLAHDGELTRTWVRMQRDWEQARAVLAAPPPAPPARRAVWSWLGPLAGLTAAAVLAGVLIWPLYQHDDPTAALDALDWPADLPLFRWPLAAKGPAPPDPAIPPEHRAAFAAGVATALEQAPADPGWDRLRRYYTERGAGVSCPAAPCPAAQRRAWRAGHWAAWTRGVCLNPTPPAPETVRALGAARAAGDPAAALETLCAEAERLFRHYD